jgi:hypothetical protein
MPIQKEIWAADIAGKLFPDNSWMLQSVDDSMWCDGKMVHLAQAGILPNVVKSRTTVPAAASQRTDTDATYELAEYTSEPTVIRDIEEVEVNYMKRQSVLMSHAKMINHQIANWIQYEWMPELASVIIRTTGANTAANSTLPGATGTRKKATLSDFNKLRTLFTDMDVPEDGRCLLMPSYMHDGLIEDNLQILTNLVAQGDAMLTQGKISRLFGFNIYQRSRKNTIAFDNSATPIRQLPTTPFGAASNAAALAWHPDFVRRAKGEVKVYDDLDNPLYYGSLFSVAARAGGRKWYSDGTGVAAVVESI